MARDRRLEMMDGIVLRENRNMLALAERVGFKHERSRDDPELVVRVGWVAAAGWVARADPPAPSTSTVLAGISTIISRAWFAPIQSVL